MMRPLLLALTLGLVSHCATASASKNAGDAAVHENEGAVALADGDYARAIELAMPKARTGDPEYEFSVGLFQLQWLEDPKAREAPKHSAKDALTWIYKAARAGLPQAAGILREGYQWGRYSLPRNSERAACWRRVERGEEQASTCVAKEPAAPY